jgi:hypothetical protein
MRRQGAVGPGAHRRASWLQSAPLPAAGVGLVSAEWMLVGELGTPAMQLRTLRHLADAWADPVASVLVLMAMVAEALAAYLLVVLVLRSLCMLPGSIGQASARVASVVAPVAVRRALDLLVGGTLLAQATLAVTPAPRDHRSGPAPTVLVMSSNFTGMFHPASPPDQVASGVAATRLVQAGSGTETRPTARRSSVPLPPWLEGGPSNPAPKHHPETLEPPAGDGPRQDGPRDAAVPAGPHTVRPHDTLWDIAAAHLAPADRTAANIHRYWQQVYRASRRAIGADPDMILPGTLLDVPSYRREHR